MPKCRQCKVDFPNRISISGITHVVANRKFCLTCSPFGKHNTKRTLETDTQTQNYIISDQWDGRKRKLYPTNCGLCGMVTYRPSRYILSVNYCSTACSSRARKTKVSLACCVCGILVDRPPERIGTPVFCSRKCKNTAHTIGAGFSTLWPPHYEKNGWEGTTYRAKAFQIYGEVCGLCGYNLDSRFLDVHHKDSNHANHRIENLQVLCVCCHSVLTRRQILNIPENVVAPSPHLT